jgi:hypothetical protein
MGMLYLKKKNAHLVYNNNDSFPFKGMFLKTLSNSKHPKGSLGIEARSSQSTTPGTPLK